MRDRQHRIARPRPATIMTYRSACGCRSNRAHPFSEERSRAQSAISPDRTTVVRPWLWRVGFAGSHPAMRAGYRSKMALALCLSTKFSRKIAAGPPFQMTVSSAADATTARSWRPGPTPGTSASVPIHIIYCVCGRHVRGHVLGHADCRRRVRVGSQLGRAPWMRALCQRVQNRFVRLANNLPLAARRSLGHIGLMETWPSG